jgi:hypothetical protein
MPYVSDIEKLLSFFSNEQQRNHFDFSRNIAFCTFAKHSLFRALIFHFSAHIKTARNIGKFETSFSFLMVSRT